MERPKSNNSQRVLAFCAVTTLCFGIYKFSNINQEINNYSIQNLIVEENNGKDIKKTETPNKLVKNRPIKEIEEKSQSKSIYSKEKEGKKITSHSTPSHRKQSYQQYINLSKKKSEISIAILRNDGSIDWECNEMLMEYFNNKGLTVNNNFFKESFYKSENFGLLFNGSLDGIYSLIQNQTNKLIIGRTKILIKNNKFKFPTAKIQLNLKEINIQDDNLIRPIYSGTTQSISGGSPEEAIDKSYKLLTENISKIKL